MAGGYRAVLSSVRAAAGAAGTDRPGAAGWTTTLPRGDVFASRSAARRDARSRVTPPPRVRCRGPRGNWPRKRRLRGRADGAARAAGAGQRGAATFDLAEFEARVRENGERRLRGACRDPRQERGERGCACRRVSRGFVLRARGAAAGAGAARRATAAETIAPSRVRYRDPRRNGPRKRCPGAGVRTRRPERRERGCARPWAPRGLPYVREARLRPLTSAATAVETKSQRAARGTRSAVPA